MLDYLTANVKKTLYFIKRNGWKETWNAVWERLQRDRDGYTYEEPKPETLEVQRTECRNIRSPKFSVVVPVYRTPERYFREMIDSVKQQTYPAWELVLADASEDNGLEAVVQEYEDDRILYCSLPDNQGISVNTNRALEYVTGDYVALLDHDDMLTPDALYEVYHAIQKSETLGLTVGMVYSDEDKCDGDSHSFYEPSRKDDFNLDWLLTNNYICHLMVMKTELIRSLQFRPAYDGAQDYDLTLRAVGELLSAPGGEKLLNSSEVEKLICHIPKVLYHWRCHRASTASNPQSKEYAYEAGRRALQDFADRKGWQVKVEHMGHRGSYRMRYEADIFDVRSDLGAVGGTIIQKGKIVGGRMTAEGKAIYEGLRASYCNSLPCQDSAVLDIRNLRLRPELQDLLQELFDVPYATVRLAKPKERNGVEDENEIFDSAILPEGIDYKEASILLSREIYNRGYHMLYMPNRAVTMEKN